MKDQAYSFHVLGTCPILSPTENMHWNVTVKWNVTVNCDYQYKTPGNPHSTCSTAPEVPETRYKRAIVPRISAQESRRRSHRHRGKWTSEADRLVILTIMPQPKAVG
jgi:hypothetical protein